MIIKIPISAGELVDKITILEIKSEFISVKAKLIIINNELTLVNKEFVKIKRDFPKHAKIIDNSKKDLYNINKKLWIIEDRLRELESNKNFKAEFIETARKVYILNDKRAKVKSKINKLLGSTISEVKSYTKY